MQHRDIFINGECFLSFLKEFMPFIDHVIMSISFYLEFNFSIINITSNICIKFNFSSFTCERVLGSVCDNLC